MSPLTAGSTVSVSFPPLPLIASLSMAASAWLTRRVVDRPETLTAPPSAVAEIVSSPAVPKICTVSAAPSAGEPPRALDEVDVDRRHAGPGEVVDDDLVDPAEGVDVERLDVVQVHDDVAGAPGERDPRAVGRGGEVLVAARAVEHVGVVAGAALNDVGAVAGIPGEGVVVAAEEERRVRAAVAVDRVVAAAAEERLVAAAADERVVALAAVDALSAWRS